MEKQKLEKQFWTNTRLQLRNNYQFNDTWLDVIIRFKKRINDFYIEPVKEIQEPKKLKGEGFTIMMVLCTLIEMLAGFRRGMIHKYNKNGTAENFYYRTGNDCLYPFMKSDPIFKDHFFTLDAHGNITIDTPYLAEEFYSSVRCGIMHEARTKGDWVINGTKNPDPNEVIFITTIPSDNTISVNRDILLNRILTAFESYTVELTEDTVNGESLRRLFGRKLDDMFSIPKDLTYNWWLDY